MTTAPKFTVELTFAELRVLSDLFRETYKNEEYYATKEIDAESENWIIEQKKNSIAKRDLVSKLHERFTGEPLS